MSADDCPNCANERLLKEQAVSGMQELVSQATSPDALTVVVFPDAATGQHVSWAVEPDIMSCGNDREHALEMLADALRALIQTKAIK